MTTEQLKRDLLVKAVHAFDDKYPMTAVQRMDLGLLIGDAVDKIIEQLSAQTAEPVAWMLEFDSDDENAVTVDPKVVEMWRTQHDNPYDVTPLYTHPAKTELFKNWNTCPGCKAKWKELPENSPIMKAHRELEAREEAELQSGIISISCRPNEQNGFQTEQPSLSDERLEAIWDSTATKDDRVLAYGRAVALAQRQDSNKEPNRAK